MSSIENIGLNAVHEGLTLVAEGSTAFVQAFDPTNTDADAPAAIIQISLGRQQALAGYAVIKTADSLNKALLDIFA